MRAVNEMSVEEFRRRSKWPLEDPSRSQMPKEPKYRNAKILGLIDGLDFDSTLEAARYLQLRDQEKRGQIHDLGRQKRFLLAPKTRGMRPAYYKLDFDYRMGNTWIYEDVKGVVSASFTLKRKLLANQGYSIRVVKAKDIGDGYIALARDIRTTGISYSTGGEM